MTDKLLWHSNPIYIRFRDPNRFQFIVLFYSNPDATMNALLSSSMKAFLLSPLRPFFCAQKCSYSLIRYELISNAINRSVAHFFNWMLLFSFETRLSAHLCQITIKDNNDTYSFLHTRNPSDNMIYLFIFFSSFLFSLLCFFLNFEHTLDCDLLVLCVCDVADVYVRNYLCSS